MVWDAERTKVSPGVTEVSEYVNLQCMRRNGDSVLDAHQGRKGGTRRMPPAPFGTTGIVCTESIYVIKLP
jgi:hypothetical protein